MWVKSKNGVVFELDDVALAKKFEKEGARLFDDDPRVTGEDAEDGTKAPKARRGRRTAAKPEPAQEQVTETDAPAGSED